MAFSKAIKQWYMGLMRSAQHVSLNNKSKTVCHILGCEQQLANRAGSEGQNKSAKMSEMRVSYISCLINIGENAILVQRLKANSAL